MNSHAVDQGGMIKRINKGFIQPEEDTIVGSNTKLSITVLFFFCFVVLSGEKVCIVLHDTRLNITLLTRETFKLRKQTATLHIYIAVLSGIEEFPASYCYMFSTYCFIHRKLFKPFIFATF